MAVTHPVYRCHLVSLSCVVACFITVSRKGEQPIASIARFCRSSLWFQFESRDSLLTLMTSSIWQKRKVRCNSLPGMAGKGQLLLVYRSHSFSLYGRHSLSSPLSFNQSITLTWLGLLLPHTFNIKHLPSNCYRLQPNLHAVHVEAVLHVLLLHLTLVAKQVACN